VYENGQVMTTDMYEPTDRQAMVARYVELGGGLSALGDSPPERLFSDLVVAAARRDIAAMVEHISDRYVLQDHRVMGWEPHRGHDGFRAEWEASFAMSPDIRMEVDEVLAVGESAIAMRLRWVGTMVDGGGPFSMEVGQVVAVAEDRITSIDQFDPSDRDAMLARFAALTGQPVLGDRPPERWFAEYARRWATEGGDGLSDMAADDWVLTDRRSIAVYGQLHGREALAEIVASAHEGVRDPRFTVHEVIACDDTVIAAVISWSGIGYKGSEFRNEMGTVAVMRNGLQVTVDLYEPGDRQAMIARYAELGGRLSAPRDASAERSRAGSERLSEHPSATEEVRCYNAHHADGCARVYAEAYEADDRDAILARFAELSADGAADAARPPERVVRAVARTYTAHDLDAFAAQYAEDCTIVDHRPIGWGTLAGRAAIRENVAAAFASSADIRMDIDEVLACDDRVIAVIASYRGHAGESEGSAEFELTYGYVAMCENGQTLHADIYEPGDRKAMIVRYTELGGGLSALGDTAPERLWAEFARRVARQEIEPLLQLFSDEYVLVDRRMIGWEPTRGHDGVRALMTSAWASSLDIRTEVDEVLAVTDRVIAFRLRWVGHSAETGGGEGVIDAGEVAVIEDGQFVRTEYFASDDRDGMLARFDELSA
jgi:ketosteroid isomerase-like protein